MSQGHNRGATPQPVTGRKRDLVVFLDKAIFQMAKHWLALINLFWGLYVGLPVVTPVMMDAGWEIPAKAIYTLYRPACHQRPTRSFFYGGPQWVYTPEELAEAGVDINPLSRAIGNEQVGWKMAFCQRDVAIYGSIFVMGLFYGLFRKRLGTWQLKFRYYLLFLAPMGVDGVLQLFGLYESTWQMRTLTGVSFGLGSVLFAYPYLEEGFGDVRRTINSKLHLE